MFDLQSRVNVCLCPVYAVNKQILMLTGHSGGVYDIIEIGSKLRKDFLTHVQEVPSVPNSSLTSIRSARLTK